MNRRIVLRRMSSEDFTYISPSDLIVTICREGEALSAGDSVADLGKDEKNPLFVHVPEQKKG